MEHISFTATTGIAKLSSKTQLHFTGNPQPTGMFPYEVAKEAKNHPWYGTKFKMTPRGEKLFNAYQAAEAAGTPLEQVVIDTKKASTKRVPPPRKQKAGKQSKTPKAPVTPPAPPEAKKE